MSRNKKRLMRVIIAIVAFLALTIIFNITGLKSYKAVARSLNFKDYRLYAYCLPYLAVYVLVGYDVLFRSVKNVLHGRLMDENFLMTVATLGAIALFELSEAVGVMLFYQVGELFQSYAVGKSRKSISALMDVCPETACVLRGGEEVIISPDEVLLGETLIIRAGEKIPVDGVVTSGQSTLDTSSLTGESLPRAVIEGDGVLSGSINLSGVLKIEATKVFEDSTVAKILDLVENSATKKARAEGFITRFARYYTPAVVLCAIALGLIPPLFFGGWVTWLSRALTFLVVSCPCALVISVPLSFFGGIGGASKRGILIKGGSYLESLAKCKTVVFDKTGTLTRGRFEVSGVYALGSEEELLRLAYIAESHSIHPIAQAVLNYAPPVNTKGYAFKEFAGKGVMAEGNGEVILAGSRRLLTENGIAVEGDDFSGSAVYLAKNGVFVGCITVEDSLKDNACAVVEELKTQGVSAIMLTGDNDVSAGKVADRLSVEYVANLLPQDKVSEVEALLKNNGKGKTLAFIGDGINDAPVLTIADVGISMGGIGSDAAIEASDVVLMNDDLACISTAIKIAKKTMRIVKQNIVFALGVKVGVLILSALGITGMWLAVFADVGVAVIAILNAMRALVVKK